MLIDGSRHRTFKAFIEYYVKEYSVGQIANQLCDVMDGLITPVQVEAVQWTIDATRNMAEDKAFWRQDCVHVLGEIRSAAVSYFERQKVNPPDDILFDIVQAVVLNFAVKPSDGK
jgi:hypothetical protein